MLWKLFKQYLIRPCLGDLIVVQLRPDAEYERTPPAAAPARNFPRQLDKGNRTQQVIFRQRVQQFTQRSLTGASSSPRATKKDAPRVLSQNLLVHRVLAERVLIKQQRQAFVQCRDSLLRLASPICSLNQKSRAPPGEHQARWA